MHNATLTRDALVHAAVLPLSVFRYGSNRHRYVDVRSPRFSAPLRPRGALFQPLGSPLEVHTQPCALSSRPSSSRNHRLNRFCRSLSCLGQTCVRPNTECAPQEGVFRAHGRMLHVHVLATTPTQRATTATLPSPLLPARAHIRAPLFGHWPQQNAFLL